MPRKKVAFYYLMGIDNMKLFDIFLVLIIREQSKFI